MSKTKQFTKQELEAAAVAFVQKQGAGEELEWRWERAGMLNQFIVTLFQNAATPTLAGLSETVDTSAPWYVEQAKRWQALEDQGWQFDEPTSRVHMIGLRMTRPASAGELVFSLYAPSHLTFRQIHTSLLEACELCAGLRKTPTTPR